MKKLLISIFLFPLCAFADNLEVTGQFVIAPVSSEKCESSAITTPTMGLSSNNKLFEMITPFNSTDDYISGIDYVIKEIPKEGRIPAIYGINGQRTTLTKQGVYIIVDTKGNRKKVIISQQHN